MTTTCRRTRRLAGLARRRGPAHRRGACRIPPGTSARRRATLLPGSLPGDALHSQRGPDQAGRRRLALWAVAASWRERLRPLLETFLEELGDGVPARNHVLLYRRLLASIGSEEVEGLSDLHYLQGTQQLALGHLAADYLPEVIGYNLGYEQPPLHLLITTQELRELGFDSYYFQLHVTIDNAASGHARKALRALYDNLPQLGERAAFLERVRNGYRLNEVGLSTTQVIDGFDLEEELLAMFERKRPYAAGMHSDRCRIGGRTVNQWLAVPGRFPAFLACLEEEGWIRRHADPRGSRFWNLIEGDRAAMFGVFTPYERQLLYDWIAGDWQAPLRRTGTRLRRWRSRRRRAATWTPSRSRCDASCCGYPRAGRRTPSRTDGPAPPPRTRRSPCHADVQPALEGRPCPA